MAKASQNSMSDSLIKTLTHLKGNPRACVYTEPLWGLSMNLCMPYLSVYMLALGLSDTQIGIAVTITTLSQLFFSFLSGPVTDKMGRRKATAVLDTIAWCLPALIWWRAESFWFFIVAAILNGGSGVTNNAWHCLVIEDADKKEITKIYSIIMICSQLSAIFAPITSILISRLTLVPAIRILFLNAFILMTIKVVILYLASKETAVGKIRMEETKGKSIIQLSYGYVEVFKLMLKSKGTIFAVIIAALSWIVGIINGAFWQVIVNKKLLVPDTALPMFMILRSVFAIVFLFFIIPKISKGILKLPVLLAFASYLIGQCILILIPIEGILKYPLLCVSLAFDGFGLAALGMLSESLVALHINPEERARIMAIRFMIIMILTTPFGWIGGVLSDISRNLPFVLNMVILLAGIVVTVAYYSRNNDHSAEHF